MPCDLPAECWQGKSGKDSEGSRCGLRIFNARSELEGVMSLVDYRNAIVEHPRRLASETQGHNRIRAVRPRAIARFLAMRKFNPHLPERWAKQLFNRLFRAIAKRRRFLPSSLQLLASRFLALPETVYRVEILVSGRQQRTEHRSTRYASRPSSAIALLPEARRKCALSGHQLRVASQFLIVFAALLALGAASPLRAKPLFGSQRTLTVERIYSAPSLSGSLADDVEWEPNSRAVSYFDSDDYGDDLVTLDVKTGRRKILVSSRVLETAMPPLIPSAIQSTGLGRIEPPRYLWSPLGKALLLIGTDKLVLLNLDTMTPRTLVDTTTGASNSQSAGAADASPIGADPVGDPKFSPDGKWVSFVRGWNLWLANASTGDLRQLTTGGSEALRNGDLDWLYPEELDCTTAYWWSPDSSKIAYYEMDERPVERFPITDMSSAAGSVVYMRFPEAGTANPIVRVGVISVDGGTTQWMNTGKDTNVYLPRVVWLPDSRRVAVERLNRAQNRLDLLFCDAATGASQTALTETDPYWINIADDLYFFSGGKRFLWSSERTGYRHYYLYDISGKLLEQLTTGDWQISGNGGFGPGAASHPAVDETHGYIYFTSNKDNVLGNQLFRLSLADKSIIRITRDPGVHDPMIAPNDSAFVDTYSNAITPPRQDLYRIDGARAAVIDKDQVSDLGPYHLSPVEFLTVPANDGTKLDAELIRPRDFDANKKYPVLIDVYGGAQEQKVRNDWGYSQFLWDEMMTEKGYVVFSLDNRGSWGRGHLFEIPIYHHFGKVELEDQLAGVKYLKSLPWVDASRIGIWGWSYGGTMTLEALFNAPGVFKAGAAVAPVTDWRLYDTAYTERYMGLPQDNPTGYYQSSPINQAQNLQGKLFIAHGTGDDNVHFANTAELLNRFIAIGRYPDDLFIVPGRGHSMSDRAARIELFREMTRFFETNL
jgi:dipeptidyl-peptidase 4